MLINHRLFSRGEHMANKTNNKNIWIIAVVVIATAVFIFGNFRDLTGEQIYDYEKGIKAIWWIECSGRKHVNRR